MWHVTNRGGQWDIAETLECRFFTVSPSDLPEVLERLLGAVEGSHYANPRDLLAEWEWEDEDWRPGEECLTAGERNQ